MIFVNWTKKAISTLDGIYDYLNREAPFYAKHTLEQIISSVERLEAHPLSGRKVPEAEHDDIREVIFQHYRIIYLIVNDSQIDIIGVVHSSRNLNNPSTQPWKTH